MRRFANAPVCMQGPDVARCVDCEQRTFSSCKVLEHIPRDVLWTTDYATEASGPEHQVFSLECITLRPSWLESTS